MADRYRDERDHRGEAWRERDERWRGTEGERPFTERASDEVRSWFGDEEARRRREFDERRDEPMWRRDRGESSWRSDPSWRSEMSWRERAERAWDEGRSRVTSRPDYGQEGRNIGDWGRPEYGTTFDRDRGARGYGATDLNRERDFGRSDRYANADEGSAYGSRTWIEHRPSGYGRGRESYRGTSGYETGRGPGNFGSWGRLAESRSMSSSPDWETGPFVGRGPRGYQRSDERVREEICERLTRHGRIDATELEISVKNGEVTLSGSVDDREAKRLAEDLAEDVFGVRDVNNQIKVYRGEMQAVGTSGAGRSAASTRDRQAGGTVEGLAGTANTPEITPPDRGEPKKA